MSEVCNIRLQIGEYCYLVLNNKYCLIQITRKQNGSKIATKTQLKLWDFCTDFYLPKKTDFWKKHLVTLGAHSNSSNQFSIIIRGKVLYVIIV